MNVLTIDDEAGALEVLNRAVLEAVPNAKLQAFTSAVDALEAIRRGNALPDVAFLDVKMPGMTGLEMAKCVKDLSPCTNIIFVTAYSSYVFDALSLHPSGYVLKPATGEAIETELKNLRFPVRENAHRLRVQCFGNFEVYADEQPVHFEFSRTKELFAYLIDRCGASVNTAELCCALWEDDDYSRKVQLRKYLADLSHTLERVGAAEVFLKTRNSFAVDKDALECDYYSFRRGRAEAVNAYFGEYMTQYSWAEMTLGSLQNKL
jgi:two-component system LytT family response regulator